MRALRRWLGNWAFDASFCIAWKAAGRGRQGAPPQQEKVPASRFFCYAHPQPETYHWLLFFSQWQPSPNSTVSTRNAGHFRYPLNRGHPANSPEHTKRAPPLVPARFRGRSPQSSALSLVQTSRSACVLPLRSRMGDPPQPLRRVIACGCIWKEVELQIADIVRQHLRIFKGTVLPQHRILITLQGLGGWCRRWPIRQGPIAINKFDVQILTQFP